MYILLPSSSFLLVCLQFANKLRLAVQYLVQIRQLLLQILNQISSFLVCCCCLCETIQGELGLASYTIILLVLVPDNIGIITSMREALQAQHLSVQLLDGLLVLDSLRFKLL